MESGLQVYIEKGWWVEFPLESPWASPGKPCESDVRIEQQEMMKEQAGLRKSGRGLGKMGGAYAENILRLRRWSNKSLKRSISFHNGTKGVS